MVKNISFNYNHETGESECIIIYHNMTFKGKAKCHPDDIDFKSERVGMTIAEARANIQVLKWIQKHEIQPQLQILKHLYSNIQTSIRCNPNSYENKMIRSQIQVLEKELAAITNDLIDEKQFLKNYCEGKEKLYKRLRAKKQ